ncbi:YdbL family protein [Sphingomonas qomolangmaensis]|uniref:YdbL family protein n=1 Tax=Sphingomonas qomolangmaensis TaxID=2918765 RepID=A0ABY5L763_9SPHN|nr:YdbL family protein [Sphingomonas qomolangmaensis]UUL82805.1 YdbL family protein [Sphingomonas qomolangmaensis]
MRIAKWMIGLALVAGVAGTAQAQRDPDYAAARAAGQIGEQTDGYLGVVGNAPDNVRAIVRDINIKRKSVYTQRAGAGSTIEQFAFVSGCNLIARTEPGEMYQTPSGAWKQRGAGAPERDPRCV